MKSAFVVKKPRTAAIRALNYNPYVEAFRQKRSKLDSVPLGELVDELGPAYGSVFTRIDCTPEHGVELLSQTDMFAAEPRGRVIRMDSMPHPERHRIRRWQVLIAGAGTLGETELFGRALIADSRLIDKYVGPHAMTLHFKDPGGTLNLYTYAFLCTSIGFQAIRSTSYGTKVLGLRKDMLRDLPVPVADHSTSCMIADLVKVAVMQRQQYLNELQAARKLIEELPEMRVAEALCQNRIKRCLKWSGDLSTMLAWTYASTGGALEYLQKQWPGRLGDILEPRGVFNGPRFARISCEAPHGVDFLSQRHVFMMRPIARRIVHPAVSKRLLFVPEGSLLVGGHGTLNEGEIFGRVLYIFGRLSHMAFTQDLLRVQPKADFSATAYGFLSTTVGFRLLRSTAVGTKLLTMRPDLLRHIPFPDCDRNLMTAINNHLIASIVAREEQHRNEQEAIRILEEEVLPEWLN